MGFEIQSDKPAESVSQRRGTTLVVLIGRKLLRQLEPLRIQPLRVFAAPHAQPLSRLGDRGWSPRAGPAEGRRHGSSHAIMGATRSQLHSLDTRKNVLTTCSAGDAAGPCLLQRGLSASAVFPVKSERNWDRKSFSFLASRSLNMASSRWATSGGPPSECNGRSNFPAARGRQIRAPITLG